MNIGKMSVIIAVGPLALVGAHFFLSTFYASGEFRWLVFLAIFAAIILGGSYLLYRNHLRLVAQAEKDDQMRNEQRNQSSQNRHKKKKRK